MPNARDREATVGDQTQRRAGAKDDLQYHVLPDDPVAALNILRAAAGLEPWPGAEQRAEVRL
jgi:hypothetical protein